MQTEIRCFAERDVGFALTQTAREGWDSTPELFRACLTHDPCGCFVGLIDGNPVGIITTTRYRCTAWIGNLIVAPDKRKQGIGRRLMRRAMEHLSGQGVRTIRLEADPPGVRLYRSLGFVDEFESMRFRLDTATADRKRARSRPSGLRSWGRGDLPLVGAFDAEHFGDERSDWLSVVLGGARAAYWVRTQQGVRGYAIVVPSALGVRIGPWLALDPEAAADLLAAVLTEFSDSAIVLGVPSVDPAVLSMLESHGMTPTPSSLRMIYGPSESSGTPEAIYAIGNGAMG